MTGFQDFRASFRALRDRDPEELFSGLPTPACLIDEEQLRQNGALLRKLAKETGVRILLAQKAFSCFDFYPLLRSCLAGTAAENLYEARLGAEKMPGGEVHVCSCAYKYEDFARLLRYADHIVFNSVTQLETFGPTAKSYKKSIGLRINPQCSTQKISPLYDPCAAGSRLGVTRDRWDLEMKDNLLAILDGLHFHTLFRQGPEALKATLKAVDRSYGELLRHMQWVNLGGGVCMTDPACEMGKLLACIHFAQDRWKTRVYLEPGEAVVHNAGFLLTRVLDLVQNGSVKIAVLDASPVCHAPDILRLPWPPMIYGAEAGDCRYRLAGPTCLPGDVWGDYSFPQPLRIGSLLVIGNRLPEASGFNGVPPARLWAWHRREECRPLTQYTYEDFLCRLGTVQ